MTSTSGLGGQVSLGVEESGVTQQNGSGESGTTRTREIILYEGEEKSQQRVNWIVERPTTANYGSDEGIGQVGKPPRQLKTRGLDRGRLTRGGGRVGDGGVVISAQRARRRTEPRPAANWEQTGSKQQSKGLRT